MTALTEKSALAEETAVAATSHRTFDAEGRTVPAQSDAVPDSDGTRQALKLRMSRPTETATVVHVAGELDAATTPRLSELLANRLTSTVETLVLDFSDVDFLGVAGLELLSHARRRANVRHMALRLVGGPACVRRALRAAALDRELTLYDTVGAAITARDPTTEDARVVA